MKLQQLLPQLLLVISTLVSCQKEIADVETKIETIEDDESIDIFEETEGDPRFLPQGLKDGMSEAGKVMAIVAGDAVDGIKAVSYRQSTTRPHNVPARI